MTRDVTVEQSGLSATEQDIRGMGALCGRRAEAAAKNRYSGGGSVVI